MKNKKYDYREGPKTFIYSVINPLIKAFIRIGVTPNAVTTAGLLLNIVATAFFLCAATSDADGTAAIGWGGLIILVAGLFDMMDGRLARMGNMSSTFGALWDSTLDRYSELLTLFGIATYLMLQGWVWSGVAAYVAMVGSIMVSYVRARAEGLGIECKVGLMQRPERVVLTGAGAVLCGIIGSAWAIVVPIIIIAVLANITAFWRIIHCYKELNKKQQ